EAAAIVFDHQHQLVSAALEQDRHATGGCIFRDVVQGLLCDAVDMRLDMRRECAGLDAPRPEDGGHAEGVRPLMDELIDRRDDPEVERPWPQLAGDEMQALIELVKERLDPLNGGARGLVPDG